MAKKQRRIETEQERTERKYRTMTKLLLRRVRKSSLIRKVFPAIMKGIHGILKDPDTARKYIIPNLLTKSNLEQRNIYKSVASVLKIVFLCLYFIDLK